TEGLLEMRQDRRLEVRALLESGEHLTRRDPRGSVAVAIRSLRHPLERRRRIDVRFSCGEVEVAECAEPVARVAPLVADRRRGQAAVEPFRAAALPEHA